MVRPISENHKPPVRYAGLTECLMYEEQKEALKEAKVKFEELRSYL